MALSDFGFGSTKSTSQSTSEGGSIGFGQNIGFGGSQAFDFSQAFGGSQATGGAATFVDPSQAGFLDFLRNAAQGQLGGQIGGAGALQSALGGLGQQAGQLGQQATANPFLQSLQQQAGGRPDLVAAQTQQLGGDISQFLQQSVLPGITSEGIQAGQLGGGRSQVARGIAGGEATRAFGRGALDIQLADQQRAQEAAQVGGGLFQQGIGQGLQAQLGGLGLAGGFAGQGFEAQFAPLQQLASILGGPTVLSQQQNQQTAFDQAFGGGQSQAFDFAQGFDFSAAFDRSQQTSTAKSKKFSLGFF